MSELRDVIAAAVEGWWGRPDPRPTLADAILEALRATLAADPSLAEQLGFEQVGLYHTEKGYPQFLHAEPYGGRCEHCQPVFRAPLAESEEPSE